MHELKLHRLTLAFSSICSGGSSTSSGGTHKFSLFFGISVKLFSKQLLYLRTTLNELRYVLLGIWLDSFSQCKNDES